MTMKWPASVERRAASTTSLDAAAERALAVLTGARHRRVTAKLIEDVLKAIRGRDDE
jgi:hypothetical protein